MHVSLETSLSSPFNNNKPRQWFSLCPHLRLVLVHGRELDLDELLNSGNLPRLLWSDFMVNRLVSPPQTKGLEGVLVESREPNGGLELCDLEVLRRRRHFVLLACSWLAPWRGTTNRVHQLWNPLFRNGKWGMKIGDWKNSPKEEPREPWTTRPGNTGRRRQLGK